MAATARKAKITFDANRHRSFVKKIQDLKNQGAAFELAALRALLEYEKTTIAWKSSPGVTFADVLREERLFPISKWRAFKRASIQLKGNVIDRLGVQAACLIGAQTIKRQFNLTRKAMDFRKKHGVDPTYQYVTELLKKHHVKKVTGPTRKQLLDYIATLKGKIQDAKLKVPAEPWS
jgi:hypothetical protein